MGQPRHSLSRHNDANFTATVFAIQQKCESSVKMQAASFNSAIRTKQASAKDIGRL